MRSIPNGWRVAALLVIAWFAVTMAACTDAVPQANQVSPQSARAVPVTVEDQASHTQPADQPQQSETNSGPQEDSADQQQPENARRDDEESAPDEGVAVIGGQCGGIPTDLHGLFDWEWQRAVPGPTVAEIEAMDLERFPPRPGAPKRSCGGSQSQFPNRLRSAGRWNCSMLGLEPLGPVRACRPIRSDRLGMWSSS